MNTCPKCGTAYPPTVRICPQDGTVLEVTESTDLQVGRVLDGKYRLDSRLGAGGMGTVYRATHLMLGKTVVVKLIKPELVTSPDIVRRFQREARAASTLAHPNIAAAYDLGQTSDGTLYIAMEFIDGTSLKDVIRTSGQIDSARIVRILRQVASALSLAHRNDVIHRDLKPHNIMITTDDHGREVAKLLDFGIAKTFDESQTLTATGFALGTPQYMSPEQATGKPIDGRSDIYALGIILYEMLVGEVPFNDPSTPAVLVKHMTESPQHPSRRRPDLTISPALEAIALRCLEKDPAARFQAVDELAAALESTTLAQGMPVAEPATVIVPRSAGQARAATAPVGGPEELAPTVVFGAAAAPAADALTATVVPPPLIAGPTETRLASPSSAPVPPVATTPATRTAAPIAPVLVTAPDGGALVPVRPAAVTVVSAPHDRRGVGPRTVAAAAAALVVIGGGLIYGLTVLRAPGDPAAPAPVTAGPVSPETSSVAPPTGVESAVTAGVPPPTPPVAPAAPAAPRPDDARVGAQANGAAPRVTPATSSVATSAAVTAPMSPGAESTPSPRRATNPVVMFRCSGVPDVCPTIRSTVESTLGAQGITVVRDAARADVVVDARVELVGRQTQEMFGTSFDVLTYSTDLDAEAPKVGQAVPMPAPLTISFDSRARTERLGDHSRLVAQGVAERVTEFWKKLP